ncbi:MAG: flagellar hook-basal body complex protein FliE [Clostridia bacterium]|nr:flagellar hook-basal body complex protein FliE [Clostridia bacterium]
MKIPMMIPETSDVTNNITPAKSQNGKGGFAEVLRNAFHHVDGLQKNADAMTQHYLAGNLDNIHQVVLAAERASIALQMTVQVRNKMVEAYQEISRMQI